MADKEKAGDRPKDELSREVEELRHVLAKLVDYEKEEKQQLQKKLEESEERFKEIFEQHYDAIILLDPKDLDCYDANLTAETLFGYSQRELREDFPRLFKNAEELETFKKIISSSVRKDFLIGQFTFAAKGGADITCGVKGKTIKIRNQDVLYCSFRDIKEKIEAEEKNKRLQVKLIQANKMTSLGTLASGIAHEINNPNNFILTNTQMFSEIWDDVEKILQAHYKEYGDFSLAGLSYEELKEMVPGMLTGTIEGSRRIASIIKSLKEFSRPVANKLHEKIDVNKAIEFSLSILESQVKKYTDTFHHIQPREALPLVHGNPQQIEQVIINLLQNALHALPDREQGVYIYASYDKETGYVIIKVKDEGIGMSKELVNRITEPFFTTKKKSGGTGLGLYISYSIIKKHKGFLEIKSQIGKGTEVTIKLPAIDRAEEEKMEQKNE
ncbi:MAG: PAS domain S-box protein [Candidatus Aminicenantes bacterium]|nr:PAS domain S-box protein [Candidatus Aminicenantes bacterium]